MMGFETEFLSENNKGLSDAIEMLSYVDDICRKNDIKYTLLYTTLLSMEDEGKIPEWLQMLQIGLLYDEYQKLQSILEQNEGKSGFYTVTYEKDNTFREQILRLYKRSNIELSENRKKDERLYDSFINIFPIYQVANTKKEFKKIQKFYMKSRKYITARAIIPGTIKCKNIKAKIKQYYYYKNREKYSVQDLNEFMKKCHSKDNKYAFIALGRKQKGIAILSSTYQTVRDVRYEGVKCCAIVETKKWLKATYTKKQIKKIKEKRKNIVLQQGTETLRRVQLIALDILIEFDRICRKHDIKYMLGAGTLLGAVRHKGFIPWDDDVDVYMLHEEWEKFIQVYEKEIDKERFFVRTQETDVDDNLCFFQIKHNNTVYCKEGREGYNTHRGVFLDIFPFYNGANNYLSHKIQEKICKRLKTVTWAHMGAQSEKRLLKRMWYIFLQKNISNKKSYGLFYKLANQYSASKYLCFLYVRRNPYKSGINQRKYFEDLIEIEYENHMFYAPREYNEFLEYLYSKDYMLYPSIAHQKNHHFPADIDLGTLHEFKK